MSLIRMTTIALLIALSIVSCCLFSVSIVIGTPVEVYAYGTAMFIFAVIFIGVTATNSDSD